MTRTNATYVSRVMEIIASRLLIKTRYNLVISFLTLENLLGMIVVVFMSHGMTIVKFFNRPNDGIRSSKSREMLLCYYLYVLSTYLCLYMNSVPIFFFLWCIYVIILIYKYRIYCICVK